MVTLCLWIFVFEFNDKLVRSCDDKLWLGWREIQKTTKSNKRPIYHAPEYNVTQNFVEDVEILLSDKCCWTLFSCYRGEVENISGGHLDFPIIQKTTNLVKDVEILLPAMIRWILFSGSEEKSKCEKFKTKGPQTDVRQRVITVVHFSLPLRCTKKLQWTVSCLT